MSMKMVQAIILNLAFPMSLDEILNIKKHKETQAVEDIIINAEKKNAGEEYLMFSWTVPKWIKPGDIVFFMHTKTSKNTINRLKNELKVSNNRYINEEVDMIRKELSHGMDIYKKYGGRIFAVGRVDKNPVYERVSEFESHWKSRIYAYVDDCYVFENPLPLSEFSSFIKLSCGGSITPVFGREYNKLKETIKQKNCIPQYLEKSNSTPIPLAGINRENWIDVSSEYRSSFLYESQFRTFYVDYLLRVLKDPKRRVYAECACKKAGGNTSFIDNVVSIGERYLPVEVKLMISSEQDLKGQVHKYCNLDELYLDKRSDRKASLDQIYSNYVLIIDTAGIYLYYDGDGSIQNLCSLKDIKQETDIINLRETLLMRLQ